MEFVKTVDMVKLLEGDVRVGRDDGVSRYRGVGGICVCGDAGVAGEEGVGGLVEMVRDVVR